MTKYFEFIDGSSTMIRSYVINRGYGTYVSLPRSWGEKNVVVLFEDATQLKVKSKLQSKQRAYVLVPAIYLDQYAIVVLA